MNALLLHGERWAELWCDALWCATWQGAIVLAVVWAIVRWCTFLSPRVMCWMWRLACLKLLVALAWGAPVNIPLLPAASSSLAPAQIWSVTFPRRARWVTHATRAYRLSIPPH